MASVSPNIIVPAAIFWGLTNYEIAQGRVERHDYDGMEFRIPDYEGFLGQSREIMPQRPIQFVNEIVNEILMRIA